MTHLRQIMLEEVERRNYAPSTIRAYIRTVEHFARHFHRSPDQLGREHICQYQAAMFRTGKLDPNTVTMKSIWPSVRYPVSGLIERRSRTTGRRLRQRTITTQSTGVYISG